MNRPCTLRTQPSRIGLIDTSAAARILLTTAALLGIHPISALALQQRHISRVRASASAQNETPAAPPTSEQRVNGYRILRWSFEKPGQLKRETLVIRDRDGRTVVRVTDDTVSVELLKDLTGKGVPDIVISSFSGGAHCCEMYYVYSLGASPSCLLVYNKGNVGMLKAADVDGDGRNEILTDYDGFAYVYGAYAISPHVPVVLAYRNGRYVDATPRYPAVLEKSITETGKRLHEAGLADKKKRLSDDNDERFTALVEWYATDLMLETPAAALQHTLNRLSLRDRPVFLKHAKEIRSILAARVRRCSYPRPYDLHVGTPYR